MSAPAVAAGLAAALGVPLAWEGIGMLQRARVGTALGVALAPLRGAGGGADDVTAAERRRLLVLLVGALAGSGWLLAGRWAALAAATAGPWLVGRVLALRRARWRRGMADGAAVAARAIADALSGGHAVRGALVEAAIAGGAGRTVDAELARVRAALELGARTEDVLHELRGRAAGPAWDTLVAAILLQRTAGGDLAGLLRELAGELEAVRRVEADARAATAQARFTARTVAALPVVAALLAELAAPGTMRAIAAEPLALALAGAAVVLQGVGMAVVARLARVQEGA